MPKDFPHFPNIHKMRVKKEVDKTEITIEPVSAVILKEYPDIKAFSVDKISEKYHDACKPWTTEMDDELTVMYCEGVTIRDMAKHFGRSKGAIRSRIKKLELEELYG